MKVICKCMVCLAPEVKDTGNQLLEIPPDTKIEGGMPVMGFTMCPNHHLLYMNGYVAIIETESEQVENSKCSVKDTPRTGRYAHIHASALDAQAYQNLVKPDGTLYPMVYVGKQKFAEVEAMYERLSLDDNQLN